MPAAVLHYPRGEDWDFLRHVGLRWARQLFLVSPQSVLFGLRNPHPRLIPDAEFVRILTRTTIARQLVSRFDEDDDRAFRPWLDRTGGHGLHKFDCSMLDGFRTLPGLHTAGTVTLLSQDSDGSWRALAIRIGALVLEPGDGDAWRLAKLFVLHGAAQHTIFCRHVPWHFPYDTVNAVTKTSVPTDHLLYRLLDRHFRFSLALSNAALHSELSVAHNYQHLAYSAFAFDNEAQFRMAAIGYKGISGNSAYAAYRFPLECPPMAGEFGVFQKLYWEVIQRFVSAAIVEIPADDPVVVSWSAHVARWIPGFPDGVRIQEPGVLAATLTSIIWDVTVGHASDHYSLGLEDLRALPVRMRVPPPTSKDVRGVHPALMTNWRDMARYHLMWEMFIKESTVTRLVDMEYRFDSDPPRRAADRFADELRRLDANLPVHRFIPVDRISASIQF
jgi:hypothetical protein